MYECSCRGVRAYVCVRVKRGMGGVIGEISNRQGTSPEDPARAVRGVGSSRRLDLSTESGRASSNGNHRSSDSERARGNRNDLRSDSRRTTAGTNTIHLAFQSARNRSSERFASYRRKHRSSQPMTVSLTSVLKRGHPQRTRPSPQQRRCEHARALWVHERA